MALAGPSGIRAGQVSNINGRLKAERPPASAGPTSAGRAATLTPFTPLYSTGPCYNHAYVPGPRFGSKSS